VRSVSDAFRPAWDHMVHMLFTPFQLDRWFSLGFCAFLAQLTGGGGGGNWTRLMQHGGDGRESEIFREGWQWVLGHLPLVLTLAGIAALLVIVFTAVMIWLSARGTFMFMDNVVHQRAEVAEPWRRFRTPANRLAVFHLVFGFGLLALVALIGVGGWLVARPDIAAGHFGVHALAAVIGGGLLLVVTLVAGAAVNLVVDDFCVPIMVLREVGVLEALEIFRREALPGHVGSLVAFYLLRMVMGMVGGLALIVAGCATCCLGFLPYLSSVLALPMLVFFRAYSLHFLGQLGPQWQLWPEREA